MNPSVGLSASMNPILLSPNGRRVRTITVPGLGRIALTRDRGEGGLFNQLLVSTRLTFRGSLPRAILVPLRASLGFAGALHRAGAKALGLAGRVRPHSKNGKSAPKGARITPGLTPKKGLTPKAGLRPHGLLVSSSSGRVSPRPAHVRERLTPKRGLVPRKGLHPKGPQVEPD